MTLTRLTTKCPECGTVFALNRVRTERVEEIKDKTPCFFCWKKREPDDAAEKRSVER